MTDNELNTELLNAELPDPRFVDAEYLAWLYDQNPDGPAIQAAADEDGVRVAHYALVPQTYRNAAGAAPFLFSLNAVTRRGTQRKGYWSELGLRNFAEATALGRQLVIGVPNEKSTPGAVKYLSYRLLGPMPVKVAVPTGSGGGWDHHVVDEPFLASATLHRPGRRPGPARRGPLDQQLRPGSAGVAPGPPPRALCRARR